MRHLKKLVRSTLDTGQSLVEYTLIVALTVVAFGLALAATGPAIGNVFSNTIFNLVGQSGPIQELPDRSGFWGTVTWVAQQTPQETPLATRTPLPSTPTSTPGPSPTHTLTSVPTTPAPTATFTPSPTPADIGHIAPWTDSANADQRIHWRLDDTNSYFGGSDWFGTYFNSLNFTGAPFASGENQYVIGPAQFQVLSQNYGTGGPVAGGPTDNFSIRWRRPITVPAATTLNFNVNAIRNSGVRVFIVGGSFGGDPSHTSGSPGGCSGVLRRDGSAGQFVRSDDPLRGSELSHENNTTRRDRTNRTGGWHVIDDAEVAAGRASQFECLVIDRWHASDNDRAIAGVRRTVPAGNYTIIVEFVHTTRNARVDLNFSNALGRINPDDAAIDGAGNPTAGLANCAFNNVTTERSDTASMMWKEFGSDFNAGLPGQMRCYLELRGFVEIPTTMTQPRFSFWDLWDIRANVSAWVEIADYDPNNDGIFDRAALAWQRVNLRQNDTFNYNWTHNIINLEPFLATSTSRRLTIRFGMERRDNANQRMTWYLDSMRIDNMPTGTLYTNQSWDLNSMDQLASFITSGRWNLTSEQAVGGMSFHESPGGFTTRSDANRSGNASLDNRDQRVHAIEFNGFIDLDDPRGQTDDDGDQGDPILTFLHRYNLGTRTGIEVQFSTDAYGVGPATWTAVPDGGQVLSRNLPGDQNLNSFETVTVNLDSIGQRRFRLRLALIVRADADRRAGWWVDNIRLERSGRVRFIPYPFVDDAENPAALSDNYTLSGSWARVDEGRRPPAGQSGWSYTDSPAGNFTTIPGDYSITFRRTLDLYNDSPENVFSPACNLGPLCEADNITPTNPMLTFWHRRYLTFNTILAVDWKRTSAPISQWRPLWTYDANNSRVVSTSGIPSTASDRTRINDAWEFVSVDLAPVLARLLADNPNSRTDADRTDDDIMLRIRFTVGSVSSPRDGLYIDDIRLEERDDEVWALWTIGETRTNNAGQVIQTAGTPVLGHGTAYQDELDNTPWFDIWHVGGGWDAVSFEQRTGLLAFHDSTTDLASTANRAPNFDHPEGTNGVLRTQTFNVLEMRTIVDLRGTRVSDRPILYFWTRFYAGNDRDFLSLQISREDVTNSQNACPNVSSPVAGVTQCYQKEHGWRQWETVWSRVGTRNYAWQRAQIDLTPFAQAPGQDGTRIRLRFVSDTLRTSPETGHRDGWYIDNLTFTYFQPQVMPIGIGLPGGGAFSDQTRSMDNWIAEGGWGLTPAISKGGGGGVTTLGGNPWNFRVWRRAEVSPVTPNCFDWLDCARRFLDSPASDTTAPWHSGAVAGIRENWMTNGPRNAGGQMVRDEFVYRWTMTTPPTLLPNRYIFVTAADDGVRLRYDTNPPGGLPPAAAGDPPTYGTRWNIVNNWQYQARTTTVSSARIMGGTSYTFTMEYFEGFGDASVQLTIGTFAFSMTAQVPRGTGRQENEQVAVMRNSDSAVMSRSVFDLRQAINPVLTFSTYFELGGEASVEVSTDGGFTWTTAGLQGELNPSDIWVGPWWGYYWNNTGTGPDRWLDFQATGWPSPPPNFASQPVTFRGSPRTRNEGNAIAHVWPGAPMTGINPDNFGVRFVRRLNTTSPITLTFTVRGDDGYRLWVNYTPGCATISNDTARPVLSGGRNWGRANTDFPDPSASCLIIDDWQDQGPQTRTVTRTVPAGAVIMLDHYEATSGAEIRLDIRTGSFSSPRWSGTYTPDFTADPSTGWQDRIYDLSSYAGPGRPPIMLRFRVNRIAHDEVSVDSNTRNGNTFNWPVGLWLADINLFDVGS